MSLPSRVGAVALLAASLAGCQMLGGGGGVMPESDVGPPPSLRGSMPNRGARVATVDPDGQPLQTAPTRRLDLPKAGRSAGNGGPTPERRIRRDEIEGNAEAGASGGPTLAPGLGANGNVGLGGKF
ncbi:hypothetical protein [Methylobacterium sp. sgz302541]|uniref:hypothetical protein n=1 Tax=unclassified Methylobacterium TaxID=2615210 RepID=UPI003D355050